MDRSVFLSALDAARIVADIVAVNKEIPEKYNRRVIVTSDTVCSTNREMAIVVKMRALAPEQVKYIEFWTTADAVEYRQKGEAVESAKASPTEWQFAADDLVKLFPDPDVLVSTHEARVISPQHLISACAFFKAPDDAWVNIVADFPAPFFCSPTSSSPVLHYNPAKPSQEVSTHIQRKYLSALGVTAEMWRKANDLSEDDFILFVTRHHAIYTSSDFTYRAIVAIVDPR